MNCASVPTGIAESELFGHVKGAFSGATMNRRGVFVEANGGTLFLDEIGELAIETQAKLLRALQEGSFRTIGAEGERKVDVRVVAATHRDLRATIKNGGSFREDLYYRLADVKLHVPPLRERGEDILLLAEHFIQHVGGGYTLANATSRALARHKWRGNVRELKSAITRACIFAPRSELQPIDVLPDGASSAVSDATICLQGKTLDDIYRDIFRYAMKEYGGTIRGAAAGLQMAKSTLFDEAKRLGMPLGRADAPSTTKTQDVTKHGDEDEKDDG
jgi:transcriptional regulator with GAF, ATPase, and Fis domain